MPSSSIPCPVEGCPSSFQDRSSLLKHIRAMMDHQTDEIISLLVMKRCTQCHLPFSKKGFSRHACNLATSESQIDGTDSTNNHTPPHPSDNDLNVPHHENPSPNSPTPHVAAIDLDTYETIIQHAEVISHSPFKHFRSIKASILPDVRATTKVVLEALVQRIESGINARTAILALLNLPVLITTAYDKRGGHSGDNNVKKTLLKIRNASDVVECTLRLLSKVPIPEINSNSSHESNKITETFVSRLKTMVGKARPGKALQLLEARVKGQTIASTSESLEQLNTLFPPRTDADLLPEDNSYDSIMVFTREDLLDELSTLPKLSSPGFTGWTYESVQLLCGDFTYDCSHVITKLFNFILAGRVEHADLWLAAKLIPVRKEGSNGIRPLVVSDVWYRILSRMVAKSVKQQAETVLAPLQVGVATKSACESIGHISYLYDACMISQAGVGQDLSILSIDFVNAFNSISRGAIYDELCRSFPKLRPLFKFAYGNVTPLYMVDGSMGCSSATGVKQGDPLGPLYFALGMQPILRKTLSFPNVRVFAYLDDVNVYASQTDSLHVFDLIRREGEKVGLKVNSSKSVLHSSNPPPVDIIPSPPVWDPHGLKVLGVPIGAPDFIREILADKFGKSSKILTVLQDMDSALALPLINQCVNARPLFLIRTVLPSIIKPYAEDFDKAVDVCLARLCKQAMPLDELSGLVRHLPVDAGGIGLRRMSRCDAHYAHSFVSAVVMLDRLGCHEFLVQLMRVTSRRNLSFDVVKQFVTNFNVFRSDINSLDDYPLIDGAEISQKLLQPRTMMLQGNFQIYERVIELLGDQPARKAWFLSQACSGTAAWMWCGCSLTPITHMEEDQFRFSLTMRLLLPITGSIPNRARKCDCGEVIGMNECDFGYHALNCPRLADLRTRRHDWCCSAMESFLMSCDLHDGFERKPKLTHGDVTLEADIKVIHQGQPLYLDLSICNPAAVKYLNQGSADEGGRASRAKEHQKELHYQTLGPELGGKVDPLILEATSRMSERFSAFVDKVAGLDSTVEHPDKKMKAVRKHLFNRLCVHIMKGNFYSIKRFLERSEYVVNN